MTAKIKLKDYLVQNNLAESVQRAEALVLARCVTIDGEPAQSSGQLISANSKISVVGPKEYVGRGALKLEGALSSFGIQVSGKVCADVGASTGGFTQVLLNHGAAKVFAIDVAYGELAWILRNDSRVVLMERTNARLLESLPEPVSFVSVDVSFISVELILPQVIKWLGESAEADMVILIKPQFEAPAESVPSGGVISDPEIHRSAIEKVLNTSNALGFGCAGLIQSPIQGTEGNREFLMWLKPHGRNLSGLAELINSVIKP